MTGIGDNSDIGADIGDETGVLSYLVGDCLLSILSFFHLIVLVIECFGYRLVNLP